MISYFVLCLVALLAGVGFIRLFRVADNGFKYSVLLAPPLMMVVWAVCLGATIPLGIPVKDSWLAIYLLTTGLAVGGSFVVYRQGLWRQCLVVAIPLLLPPLFFYPYLVHGLSAYIGSPAWDGWSYVANGQYLWTYPLGSDGGLRPLYQYGAHLAETRFAATGMLGLLSPLTLQPGETHAARGLFVFWSFFVAGCSTLFFALQQEWKMIYRILYLVLAVYSGWLLMTLVASNYDNLLILTVLPAFAACCRYGGIVGGRELPLMGLFVAGLIYFYAEMSILALFIGFVLVCGRRETALQKVRFLTGSSLLGFVLLAPYLKILAVYFQRQLTAAEMVNAARPGEGLMPELLWVKYSFPIYWGTWLNSLEGVFPSIKTALLCGAWLAALCLALCFLLACRSLLKRRDMSLVVVSWTFIAASLFFMLVKSYDYGAYKIIVMNWWLVAFLIVMGLQQSMIFVADNYGQKREMAVCVVVMVCFAILGWGKIMLLDRMVQPKTIQDYQGLRAVIPAGDNNGVALAVADDEANAWAVYFLCDNPLKILQLRHFMAQPYTRSFMDRSQLVAPADIRFVVSDAGSCTGNETVQIMAAKAGRYCVLEVVKPDWFDLQAVHNPNGNEVFDGKPFYWLGKGETEISIVAAAVKAVTVEFDLELGPSLPESMPRRLRVSLGAEPVQELLIVRNGKIALTLRLQPGINKLVLTSPDQPTVARLPGGDRRPLILKLQNLQIRP
jgi:hypothetical protein